MNRVKNIVMAVVILSIVFSLCQMIGNSYAEENTNNDSHYDTERGIVLDDIDGDTWPDVTEELRGTDPQDSESFPGPKKITGQKQLKGEDVSTSQLSASGFPASSCRSGFRQAGQRLCIDIFVKGPMYYDDATVYCRNRKARVATYEDLYYLYVSTSMDATYNPKGRWLGDFVDDDDILCGNKDITSNNDPDIFNFEGNCNKNATRTFWCAHDDDL